MPARTHHSTTSASSPSTGVRAHEAAADVVLAHHPPVGQRDPDLGQSGDGLGARRVHEADGHPLAVAAVGLGGITVAIDTGGARLPKKA